VVTGELKGLGRCREVQRCFLAWRGGSRTCPSDAALTGSVVSCLKSGGTSIARLGRLSSGQIGPVHFNSWLRISNACVESNGGIWSCSCTRRSQGGVQAAC
jgi:hypothetical protein